MNYLYRTRDTIKLLSNPLKPKNNIYHFKFNGAVTKSNVDRLTGQLRSLKEKRPQVIALSINCALGSIVQAQIAHDALKQIQNDIQVPIYTFAEDYAIGVGYYLLSLGKSVHANPFSIIGDFSVSQHVINCSALLKKHGIILEKYGNSIIFNAFEQISEEQKQFIDKKLQIDLQTIIQNVKLNRQLVQQHLDEQFLNQQVYIPQIFNNEKALTYGLIDEISTFEEFYGKNYSHLQLKEITLQKQSLLDGIGIYKQYKIMQNINYIVQQATRTSLQDAQEKLINYLKSLIQQGHISQDILNDFIIEFMNHQIVNSTYTMSKVLS